MSPASAFSQSKPCRPEGNLLRILAATALSNLVFSSKRSKSGRAAEVGSLSVDAKLATKFSSGAAKEFSAFFGIFGKFVDKNELLGFWRNLFS